jgi:small subunit ribosomal protein S2
MERNGIHIIDLRKTQILLDLARNAIHDITSQGKIVLFVGTKTQAREAIQEEARRCKMNYVTERWLGGMLTNFSTIRKSIKRLITIDKMEVDGTFDKITKKERLLLNREKDRLRRVFGGIEDMPRLPGALFVVDIKKEHIAVKEAQILGIPVIALVDTNCDPEIVDFPIPANDDSVKTIQLVSKVLADAIIEGNESYKIHAAEMGADGDRANKENDFDDDKPKRNLRERRPRREDDGGRRPRRDDRAQNKAEHSTAKPETAPVAEEKAPTTENNA